MNNKIHILLFAFSFVSFAFVVRDLKKSDEDHFEEVVNLEQEIETELSQIEQISRENDSLKTFLTYQIKQNDSLTSQINIRDYKIETIKKKLINEKDTDFLFYPDSVVLDILSNARFDASDQK